MISVTKDKQKTNCRKRLPFKGEPKADTDLEVMKKIVVNIKKRGGDFKPPNA